MADFVVRPVVEGEQRALFDVLGRALHAPPLTDEFWEKRREAFPAERKIGAFAGDEPIGVASSVGTAMAVPGGRVVPAAAVDGVGVRADHTRRGVLTAMMREQLRDLVGRGEVLAALHASETTIYGRFGYGIATRCQDVRLIRHRVRFRDHVPEGGRVRLIEVDEALELIPRLYERIGLRRPGMIERRERWWHYARHRIVGEHLTAVHTGPGGDDGFVLYKPIDRHEVTLPGALLRVRDLHAASVPALAGLWRFLLKIDLVSEIRASRPVDEPFTAMLVDSRACEVTGAWDELWVRILDVPAALAARTYRAGEPVVLEVRDTLLPQNGGRYRVTADGASRTDARAQLRLDADTLAMIYLGEWRASALAATGRIEAVDPGAPHHADDLFRVPVSPWCGTPF
ncbi:MAG TPA: GNAT family N-acetyltransferase [Amycolatopsis sp.]|uniref:GNAT family N-acetyltransferase n=1 Tax=Amycolatopsis sp. TaxID=37632 RepID=UPI002B45EBE2|nr:GNAT family N-acetyltransferase [Amycolatopsis sp.]HKS49198.1 GNAT family N-acetyltransferase [Amycolatopsis sp.]